MEIYVMVHSAWLGEWSYEDVKKELEKKGHKVVTFDLPGHGKDKTLPKDITMTSYVTKVQEMIDAQDGKVILIGHGFGGIVISQVAETKSEKIKSLVYLAAMFVPDGVSFLDAIRPVKDSIALNNLITSEDKTYLTIKEDKLHEAFGADIPIENFNAILPLLSAEPTAPLSAKLSISNEKFGSIPRYYIQTLNDNAIPTKVQESMFIGIGIDKLYTLSEGSHLPIFSHPNLLANILDDVSKQKKREIKNSDKIEVLKRVLGASSLWKNSFNAGDAKKCAGVYSENATMTAKPFGVFQNRDKIEIFWNDLIIDGYSDVEYINPIIEITSNSSAILSSHWKMNKAKGVITKELFQICKDGKIELIDDNFEVQ